MSLKAAINCGHIVIRILPFYNLYDEIVVNYFAHAHTKYTRPPFSSRPGIEARIYFASYVHCIIRILQAFNYIEA